MLLHSSAVRPSLQDGLLAGLWTMEDDHHQAAVQAAKGELGCQKLCAAAVAACPLACYCNTLSLMLHRS